MRYPIPSLVDPSRVDAQLRPELLYEYAAHTDLQYTGKALYSS